MLLSIPRNHRKPPLDSLTIVVLGDIARSPRIIRHALSFADHRWSVSIIAYSAGPASNPPIGLTQHPNINLIPLPEFPHRFTLGLPKILFAILVGPSKALYLGLSLVFILLFKANQASYILVQNPPAIPTLPIVQFSRLILGSKLIIDWHNTAYSILALKFGNDSHLVVRLAEWIEATFGKYADLHLFVTEAEKLSLSNSWNLQGKKKVFYDRPPKSFCRLTIPEIHSFIIQCSFNSDPLLLEIFNAKSTGLSNGTLLTFEELGTDAPKLKPDRPALLVSSTSWTIDEDFHVLIDALSIYAESKKTHGSLPKVMCLITGKGPLKDYYGQIVRQKSQREGWDQIGICCRSVWFEDPADYRRLLGSADLGISLHQSSSGLDLPMKVVDMFGCQLPVCARNFDCISELVKHNQNGLVFDSAGELAQQIKELLAGFNGAELSGSSKLEELRRRIPTVIYGPEVVKASSKDNDQDLSTRRWTCWEDEWYRHVLQTVQSI